MIPTTKPLPVFALSSRLLVFASPHSSTDPSSGLDPHSSNTAGVLRPSVTLGDVAQAILKVGGTVLSGMKALGGHGFNVAKNKVFGDSAPSHSPALQTSSTNRRPRSGVSALFKQTQDIHRQRSASLTKVTETITTMQSVLTASPPLPGSSGPVSGHITIFNLFPLLTPTGRAVEPEVVTNVVTPRIQLICKLFSRLMGHGLPYLRRIVTR